MDRYCQTEAEQIVSLQDPPVLINEMNAFIFSQSVSDETNEVVEQPSPSMRSVKPTVPTVPSPVVTRDSTGANNRSNRKSMFEPATTRRVSPSPTSPVVERVQFFSPHLPSAHLSFKDSIRALKNGNPNRINNLIQFFDK